MANLVLWESDKFRPGDRLLNVLDAMQGRILAKRITRQMNSSPPKHFEEIAPARKADQQSASPEGKPQQGDCSGPAVQIEVLTPSDISGSYVQFVFGATKASEDYLVYG